MKNLQKDLPNQGLNIPERIVDQKNPKEKKREKNQLLAKGVFLSAKERFKNPSNRNLQRGNVKSRKKCDRNEELKKHRR
ncbi:MAG: hypothetical protein FJ106_16010 [Deltaproteobacteria bacterium]|nr:hypothetical protein [Deltaproteobacteria bacterium]